MLMLEYRNLDVQNYYYKRNINDQINLLNVKMNDLCLARENVILVTLCN